MFIQDSNKMNSFYMRQMYKLQGAGFSPHVRPEVRMVEFPHLSFEEFGRTRQKNSREAAAEQSPGLAALFAANPGKNGDRDQP